MANRVRGEVPFKADDEDYVLVLDFNALCDLEADFPGIMDGSFELKSPTAIRKVFHTGLAKHHPELSVLSAGELISAVGIPMAGQLVAAAFKASFPEAATGSKARPPKP
ncbi:hypothetical protein GCM10017620_24630 [Brevundimonas intermedia]|uniref:Phage tail assembly protein n=1 Tax=Brevundimonas intermedia TaxID=74315 RepID=A0ABQ5TBN2_9CAUL|nr:hypothetical protein [Brevundimonas intermedia]GLK49490.1 hypothetical protein GCM10017620_24630 [Brevundimonas intermedia]